MPGNCTVDSRALKYNEELQMTLTTYFLDRISSHCISLLDRVSVFQQQILLIPNRKHLRKTGISLCMVSIQFTGVNNVKASIECLCCRHPAAGFISIIKVLQHPTAKRNAEAIFQSDLCVHSSTRTSA